MDRRTKFRQHLSPLYLPQYDSLCGVLPPHWQPYQGLRTFQDQGRLYAQGRTFPGKKVTEADAGKSAHNYGCASDWILWDIYDKPIWIDADDPAWNEYTNAIEKVGGLKSGKTFGDIDHNELAISISWSKILIEFNLGGMDAAQNLIKRNLA